MVLCLTLFYRQLLATHHSKKTFH